MSSEDLRAEIGKLLDQVDDTFLKVVHAMLDTYVNEQEEDPIIGYDIDGNPITASVAKEELLADVEAAKKGKYISLEDLKREAEKW